MPKTARLARLARLAHVAHVCSLGVWLGALVMAGTTAAIIFPAAKALGLTLPAYQGYTGEHWTLAAGMIQARIFTAADFVQLVCCLIAVATLVFALLTRTAPGLAASVIRVVAFIALFASLTGQFFFMHPPMDTALLAYWDAARSGDNARAAASLAAFEKFHTPATAAMALDAAAVMVALTVGAWAGVRDTAGPRA